MTVNSLYAKIVKVEKPPFPDGLEEYTVMNEKIAASLKNAFSLRTDQASYEEIDASIKAGSRVKGTNMCILILAIVIASIGLNMNSTAVIIGAMLISPLMGGIMAIGYGIATNDLKRALGAGMRLLFQVVICMIASTVYFMISPISTAHSELLARTSPTIWDVLIAIAGGFAGIIGTTRKEKTNVIPGVAIATALMPPLCTAGYGIATLQWNFFIGALYLFFINSFFICLTSIVMLKIMRVPCKKFMDRKSEFRLHRNMVIISIITIIPSVILAVQIVSESIVDSNVNSFLENEFSFRSTQLVQSEYNKDTNELEVALIGKPLTNAQIEELKTKLADYDLKSTGLRVTQTEVEGGVTADEVSELIASQISSTNSEKDFTAMLQANELEALKEKLSGYETAQAELEAQLEAYKAEEYDVESILEEMTALNGKVTALTLGNVSKADGTAVVSGEEAVAIAEVSSPLNLTERNQLSAWLEVKLNRKVSLSQQVAKPTALNAADENAGDEELTEENAENIE